MYKKIFFLTEPNLIFDSQWKQTTINTLIKARRHNAEWNELPLETKKKIII